MNVRGFDQTTLRSAHAANRRDALRALGAAGVAGLFAGVAREPARAKHRKNPCKKQTKQCIAVLTGVCAGNAPCLTEVQTCCPIIGRCDFNGLLDCIAA